MIMIRILLLFILLLTTTISAKAEPPGAGNVQITWHVVNRFRFFARDEEFKAQENAWRQYGIHVEEQHKAADNPLLQYDSSVLGTEHMLNDRFIPFTNFERRNFDWQGWAAQASEHTCYDRKARNHSACGGVDEYLLPKAHEIEIKLKPLNANVTLADYVCHWRVGDNPEQQAPCNEAIRAKLPYPGGATISVTTEGNSTISIEAATRDLLIAGFGDSFASGEGNPDTPVTFGNARREDNLYPARKRSDGNGGAQWLDRLCHRSLYSYQFRAALQIGLENPHVAVTYLGYACSGATVDRGIIGPQAYVEYKSGSGDSTAQAITGGRNDSEMARFLAELCRVAPTQDGGLWRCPGNQFKRNVDLAFVSIGGNDIGFANLVSWTLLRNGPTAHMAGWLGAVLPPDRFKANMQGALPEAYQKLARQFEKALPLKSEGLDFDPSRIVLTAYPDMLVDEKGINCQGNTDDGQAEDVYPANQSVDRFASWFTLRQDKLDATHAVLKDLHLRLAALAEAHGWTYAARAYADKPFAGHGFCAQRQDRLDDPAEALIVPCFGKSKRPTSTCLPGIFGTGNGWRPYDPVTQNYPYALRRRWVRTINDAFMVMNQKVVDAFGSINEAASAADFSTTTGAMHPNAEGHASLADAMLMDLRPAIAKLLGETQ